MRNSQLLSACGSLSRHVNAQVVMHRGTGCKRRTYRDHMSPLKLPSPWQKPSRARAVSASEIVESQTLGGREGLVWAVTDGSRASSLLALSA